MSHNITWLTTPGSIGSFTAGISLPPTAFVKAVAVGATIVDYKIISGELPPGIQMYPNGKFYGTPDIIPENTTNTFVVRVNAIDGATKIIKDGTFSITITGNANPTFTTPEGFLPGSPIYDSTWYEFAVAYNNPISTNKITISLKSGTLPAGLEINEFGLIRGYINPPIFTQNYSLASTTVVVTNSTNNTLTVLSTFNFYINRPIIFSGSMFGGLTAGTVYYIKEVVDSITITITDVPNGDIVSVDNGNGFMTATLPAVNTGQPTKYQYNFTLELTSPYGNDTANYSMVVKNYYLPAIEGGPLTPNKPDTRTPTILNTRPPTYDIEANNTTFGYYVLPPANSVAVPGMTYDPASDAYIGQFLINNFLNFFSFHIMGYDFDNFPITYEYENLPVWATGNTKTGWIYGDPSNVLANQISEFSFTAKATKVATLNSVTITDSSGEFKCTSISPFTLSPNLQVIVSGILEDTEILNVEITGTRGQFRFSGTSSNILLAVDMPVIVSGTLTGTGSIVGYAPPTQTYYIINTNAATGFQFSNTPGGAPIFTTPGTTAGLTFKIAPGNISGYSPPGPQTYYIKTTNGNDTFTLSSTLGGPPITTTPGITSNLMFKVIYNDISPTFNYSFRVANKIDGEITWLTDSDLGTFYNTSVSYQDIEAVSDVELTYSLVSGNLPPNLELLSNGQIVGTIAYQPSDNYQEKNSTSNYEFTVKANAYANSNMSSIITSTKTFNMTVLQEFDIVTDNLYIKCTPNIEDRAIINDLLTDTYLIPTDYIYRPDDSNFGKAKDVIYAHAYGILSSNINEYIKAVQKNHYWRDITLGSLSTATARDENGNIIYEVVFSNIIDNLMTYDPNFGVDYRFATSVSIQEVIYWPGLITLNLGPWYTSSSNLFTSYIFGSEPLLLTNFTQSDILTQYNISLQSNSVIPDFYTSLSPGYAEILYPNSLDNMRKRVEQELGADDNFRKLPLWMTSQQRDGNTLGFIPAWVICYTKPSPTIEIFVIETKDDPDLLILESTEGISINGQITFTGSTFGNILSNKIYYVIDVNVPGHPNSIKLSETKNGPSVRLYAETGFMNGTFYLGSYAEIIKDRIENDWEFKLNQIDFKIDRFTVDKQLTYDLTTYTDPNSWTVYPSATPEPNPEDSQDFYVLFPRPTILPLKTQYNL